MLILFAGIFVLTGQAAAQYAQQSVNIVGRTAFLAYFSVMRPESSRQGSGGKTSSAISHGLVGGVASQGY